MQDDRAHDHGVTPRTDHVLADARLAGRRRPARATAGQAVVVERARAVPGRRRRARRRRRRVVHGLAARARPPSLRGVVNATGVVVHTNLGRAPLSAAAVEAMAVAAGATDVELDLGERPARPRGAAARSPRWPPPCRTPAACTWSTTAPPPWRWSPALWPAAARSSWPAARWSRSATASGSPSCWSPSGARLREVGTTNRVRLADYAAAVGPETAFVLKVHPSNFVVEGFTSSVSVAELAPLASACPWSPTSAPGCWRRTRGCPTSRTPRRTLRAGADLVTASGDKLLGGPQCGLLLGRADLVQRLRRDPFARALRVDKLTLAALEATLTGPPPPVARALAVARRRPAAPGRRPLADELGAGRRRGRRRPRRPSAAAGRPASCCRAPRSRCPPRSPSRCGSASPPWSAASPAAGCCWTCWPCRPTDDDRLVEAVRRAAKH